MASLRAKSSSRFGFLELIHRAISLVLFVLLLGTGWIALSYLKSGIHSHFQKSAADSIVQNSTFTAPVEVITTVPELVYSVTGDTAYYHTSGHLPSLRRRSAMSEEAARKKGLKPCPICFRR